MKQTCKKYLLPYLWITLASAVYAFGFNWCYEPNHIGFGGITGVAQIINHFLPWAPIGTVVIILNVPLFLLGWKLIGGHLLVSSLYSMFISSLFIDLLHLRCQIHRDLVSHMGDHDAGGAEGGELILHERQPPTGLCGLWKILRDVVADADPISGEQAENQGAGIEEEDQVPFVHDHRSQALKKGQLFCLPLHALCSS